MGTDKHSPNTGSLPVHSDVSYEERDINISSVLWSLVYLAVTVVVSLAICVVFLKYSPRLVEGTNPSMPVVRQQMPKSEEQEMMLPPEPRLQGIAGHESDPQQDLRDKIAEDSAANEKIGWVDEKAGVAQIPVKEAMKLIAEKGLPPITVVPEKKK